MTQWNPGDIALCVDARDVHYALGLKEGNTYTVTVVCEQTAISPYSKGKMLTLFLLEHKNPDSNMGFDARRFIKQPSLLIEEERSTSRDLELVERN